MQYNQQVQDIHEYDDNSNYDDVFDTRNINVPAQIIDTSQCDENPQISNFNNIHKLYFDDEYYDYVENSQKPHINNDCVSTK